MQRQSFYFSENFTRMSFPIDEAVKQNTEVVNEGLNSMLTAIIQNPGIQAKQLSNIFEDSHLKTIERQIKSLTDRGYIERKGSKKTDGYWLVKN